MLGLALTRVNATPPSESDRTENLIFKQGQLLSLRISRGDPIRIFVVGREEAQINLKDVSLKIRRLKPYPGKILKLNRYGEYFEVEDKAQFNKASEIEISADLRGKSESFKIKLEGKP